MNVEWYFLSKKVHLGTHGAIKLQFEFVRVWNVQKETLLLFFKDHSLSEKLSIFEEILRDKVYVINFSVANRHLVYNEKRCYIWKRVPTAHVHKYHVHGGL